MRRFLSVLMVLAAVEPACGSRLPAAPGAGSPTVDPPSDASGLPAAKVVNATILANGCQTLGPPNAKLAESAMYALVEGCTSIPGASAEFQATLLPGGRVDIVGTPGQPDVVPICILKNPLRHRVALAKPCRLDVKLEEKTVRIR